MTANLPTRRTALLGGGAALGLAGLGLTGCGPRGRAPWTPPPRVDFPLPPAISFREVASGQALWSQDFARLLADDRLDLLILGELHDNPEHHRAQAWTVSMLDQLRRPTRPSQGRNGVGGLAFEMLTPRQAGTVNRYRASGRQRRVEQLADLGAEIGWAESGWPDWSMYAEILLAAPAAVVTGGALPREELREAARAGAARYRNAAALGLDQPLIEPEATIRARGQIDAHCGFLPEEAAPMLVDAQRIRDARFAQALIEARAAGGFSVLITGNGHARGDWGAPRFIERLDEDLRFATIGLLEAPPGVAPERVDLRSLGAQWSTAAPPFDYVIITPHRARPDPCVAFRARMSGG